MRSYSFTTAWWNDVASNNWSKGNLSGSKILCRYTGATKIVPAETLGEGGGGGRNRTSGSRFITQLWRVDSPSIPNHIVVLHWCTNLSVWRTKSDTLRSHERVHETQRHAAQLPVGATTHLPARGTPEGPWGYSCTASAIDGQTTPPPIRVR